jgi:hypothetical protein
MKARPGMRVLLEKNVWLADWEGDPGRTTNEDNAAEFESMADAMKALEEARKFRPFKNAQIVDDF